MSPTIQTNARHDGRAARSTTTEKRSDLVCKVKYNNTLPDIPFDPKSIVYPFDAHRYVQYTPSSLEQSYKFELLTEHDLGVPIDLINPDTYKVDPDGELEVEDEYLLEDESNAPLDAKRSRHHNKNVSWLRKTEYISTEYNRFHQSALKSEARLGYSIKKHMTEEVLYKDRDSQIKAIKETFEFAKAPITQHYSKPGVSALEVLPMFPDFEMWKQPCAQVIFDSDPAQKGRSSTLQNEEMSQAMIRGMVDEQGEQFVGYFLPAAETMEKHKRDLELGVDYEPDEEYEYVMAGEYNWNVKNKASSGYEENYFFVLKDDGIYYNELETRVRLSKRRKVGASAAATAKSRLIVKHRPLNPAELRQQHDRLMMLNAPGEEEEEEEGEEGGLEHHGNKSDDENHTRGGSPTGSGGGQTPDRRGAGSQASGSPRSVGSGGSRKRSRDSSPAGSAPGSPASDAGSAHGDRSQATSARASPRSRVTSGRVSPRSQATSARVSPRSQATSARGSPRSRDASVNSSPRSRAGSENGSRAGSASPARSMDGSVAGSRGDGSPAGSPRSEVHGDGSLPGSPVHEDGSDGGGSRHVSSAPNSPGGSGEGSAPNSPGQASSVAEGGYDSEAERLRNEEAAEIFGSDGDD